MRLVSGRGHYDEVVRAVGEASRSVWIATANLKELMVEDLRWTSRRRFGRTSYRSVIGVFADLATAGVELRILHAAPPSRPFRATLARRPGLAGGLQLKICPRVHFKAVVVDGDFVYVGSSNWTGAGLGAKGAGRRNFELGFAGSDDGLLDRVQELYDRVWRGAACKGCKLRDVCPAPLDRPAKQR